MSMNRVTMSGKPKILFMCQCGFTMKTSGITFKCPKCGFDPVGEVNKEAQKLREEIEVGN